MIKRQRLIDNWYLVTAFKNGSVLEFQENENSPYIEWTPDQLPTFAFGINWRVKSVVPDNLKNWFTDK